MPDHTSSITTATPAAAAFEVGRLTALLRAVVGLRGLGGSWEALSGVKNETKTFIPRLTSWFETALDGDRLVAAERRLTDLGTWDDLGPREDNREEWQRAAYPRDAGEADLEWEAAGTPQGGPDRQLPSPAWREEVSAELLEHLAVLQVEPVRAFAQDVRLLFREGPPEGFAAFEVGRLLAEVELPPFAYEAILSHEPGWRWPLDRDELRSPTRRAAFLNNPFPAPRFASRTAEIQAANALYKIAVDDYRSARCRWQRSRRQRGTEPTTRRDPFSVPFVELPGRPLIGVGPYELHPGDSTLAAVAAGAAAVGIEANDFPPVPHLLHARRLDGWHYHRLERTGVEGLREFVLEAYAVARKYLAPESKIVEGPDGIAFHPETGVASWKGRTATLTRAQHKRLFQALCEYGGRISSNLIDRDPPRFGFRGKRIARAGDTAAESTQGWEPTSEGQRRNAASNLSEKIADINLSATHRQDGEIGYIELERG